MKRVKPALTRTQEVIKLHEEINTTMAVTLKKAIRVGEILTDIRNELNHGEWLPWVAENLPFTDQTARNYMKLYYHRDQFKFKTVLNLQEAYKILQPPASEDNPENEELSEGMLTAEHVKKFTEVAKDYPEEVQKQVGNMLSKDIPHMFEDTYAAMNGEPVTIETEEEEEQPLDPGRILVKIRGKADALLYRLIELGKLFDEVSTEPFENSINSGLLFNSLEKVEKEIQSLSKKIKENYHSGC